MLRDRYGSCDGFRLFMAAIAGAYPFRRAARSVPVIRRLAPVVAVGVKGAVGCAADRADRLLGAIRRAAGVFNSCQWWVVSCLQAADQLCPVALTVSVLVAEQSAQVKVFSPAVVQVVCFFITPVSQL